MTGVCGGSPSGRRRDSASTAWPAPDALHGALPAARDAAGQWYFQLSPDAKADGSGLIDSAAVVRADPQLTHFDTLARLAPPELVKVAGRQRHALPAPHDGRRRCLGRAARRHALGGARLPEPDRVAPSRRRRQVERSPRLPDLVLTVSDMDREIYVRRFPEDQRQTAREVPNAPVKPPFEHVFAAPDGRLWLAKSDTALARVRHFQVVDQTGVLLNVAVPSYGFALGVNARLHPDG